MADYHTNRVMSIVDAVFTLVNSDKAPDTHEATVQLLNQEVDPDFASENNDVSIALRHIKEWLNADSIKQERDIEAFEDEYYLGEKSISSVAIENITDNEQFESPDSLAEVQRQKMYFALREVVSELAEREAINRLDR